MQKRQLLYLTLLLSVLMFIYFIGSITLFSSNRTLVFAGEGTYAGQLKGRTFHGQGTWKSDLGPTYVGEFKNGNFHEQGTMTFSNGAFYEGEFEDGFIHGYGVMTFPDGHTHEGNWDSDVFLEGHEDCDHDH